MPASDQPRRAARALALPQRVRARLTYQASVIADAPAEVGLADGRTVVAQPGDTRICRDGLVLDVVSPARFRAEYEVVIERGLTLSAADCNHLEETLSLGATRSVPTFVAAIERLASLRFGDIRIPFTPGQLEEIQHRARKRGRTVEAEMQAVVDRIRDELFYKGG
jgi:hypothetical protein